MTSLLEVHNYFAFKKKRLYELNIWIWFAFFIAGFKKLGDKMI